MASTGNDQSSSSCGSSTIGGFSHGVFLSFRGIDTRKGFVSHLRHALDRSGIKTFMDDTELPTGEDISPKLLQAIQGSMASIIVFSKNYASSTWCLQELVEILECKRTKGHIVIPLYYDVDASVVRHQKRKFAGAFKTHTTRVSKQKVNEWRAALQEVADLKGHVLANEDNGNEASFINNIVNKVQAEVISRGTNVMDSLIEASVDSNRDCINTLLSIGSNDVRMIGIYGMGGIGKSTVSKALYNEHKNKFDCSAVVENIKDDTDGLLHLQEKLLCQLEKKDVKLNDTGEGTQRIKRICESKKVLILLDDFDHFNQINKLEIHKGWLSTAGSRVILVTRNAKLLKEAQVKPRHMHEMKLMNMDESLKLFRKHAIEEEEEEEYPSKEQESLSLDIAKSCAGLPLCLEVIGRHLRGEDLTFWKNALKELRSKPPEDIHNSLKISYDGLSNEKKNIFLDAACFFIGWRMEYLRHFWVGCGFPENSVNDLIDRCLFKIDEENCLWMHDHVRDMGRAIVREASEGSLEKQSRLWIPEEVDDLLTSPITDKTAVEGIQLGDITVEAKAFESMRKLRFLEIKRSFEIGGSFENVFRELRWLTWKYCTLDNLPLAFHPTKLVGLNMRRSSIRKLWEGVKQFPYLKILDLSHCRLLEETPDFSGTPRLERLFLNGCGKLSKINPSICQLTSLVEIILSDCESLEEVPDFIGQLSRLVSLELECCPKLESLPTSICSLSSLEELNLYYCMNLHQLPERLGEMESLHTLNLKLCEKITRLPESICNLTALQKLDLSFCSELECLPEELGNLKYLLELNILSCKKLSCLPTSTCNLVALKKLNMGWCSNLKELPGEFGNLKNLRIFDARETPLEELPDLIRHLTSLVKLDMTGCSELECLPEELGNLKCLLELNVSSCIKLSCLPASTCNLVSLQELYMTKCLNLKELPVGLGNLKNLRTFDAIETPLEELPDSIRHLTSLVTLDLASCHNLKTLPDSICDLSILEVLNINYCYRLQNFPDRLGDMVSLRELRALDTGCKQLPDSIKKLMKLETLSFSHSDPQSNDMSEKFVIPTNSSLKRLTLNNCGLRDEDITDVIWMGLPSLQSLDLRQNNICNPSLHLHQLSNLTQLDLSYCGNLVSLSELSPNLTKLVLIWCISLVSLPELPSSLEVLYASSCTSMKVVPNLSNLQFLSTLDLGRCKSLVELQGLENLKQLGSLMLGGCNSLARNDNINESFFQRYFEYGKECTLPLWEIPDWIKYKSMKSTITFHLPHKFKGIILWVLSHDPNHIAKAVIRNNTTGQDLDLSFFSFVGTWVRCIKASVYFSMSSGDSITISIEGSDGEVVSVGLIGGSEVKAMKH